MAIRDVEVVITRETQTVSQAGFGVPLILATSKDHEFKTYTDLASVAKDFDTTTEAYAIANRIFAQNPRPQRIAIMGVQYDAENDNPLALVNALNGVAKEDFYFLLCEEQGKEEILALSEWTDAQKRIYFYSTDDPTIHAELNSDRTVSLVHKNPRSYPAEGWVGVCAPTNPGSITWKFKTINGITDAGFEPEEVTNIVETGGNTYIRQGGILHTYDGRTTSGEWIDVIRSQDYIEARIKEEVFRTLVNAAKVPYSPAGIAMVTAAVESVLKNASLNGMIATDEDGVPLYSVTAPNWADIPASERANRVLPDVRFEFQLAGAIHQVRISGVIRV